MTHALPRVETGIPGLDEVTDGGFVAGRTYLLRGGPGTGKTVLGTQFLAAGDGRSLYVTLEESVDALHENARALGLDVDGIEYLDLSPGVDAFGEGGYDVFTPGEVETNLAELIRERVDEVDPDRVFVDPITTLRFLSSDDYQFRKQVTAFGRYLREHGVTTLVATQPGESLTDDDLQFITDGTIELGHSEKGRTLAVRKLRGSDFQSGEHTMHIGEGGTTVYPKLTPGDHRQSFSTETVSSGVAELDSLLSGGIERGTVTVISGPTGVGKTTTGSHFLKEAAVRDERSVAYLFEEGEGTFSHRSESIGIPVESMQERGTLAVEPVEPLSVSPDEFAAMVREEVEERDARVVMIDGIAGYRLSIRGEGDDLVRELHSLCRYCKNMGVTVILVEEVPHVTGDFRATDENVSYLADTVLFLRYIEVQGEIRKAVGVLKKRASDFERTLRGFEITGDGVALGDPLSNLRGVLQGTPELIDTTTEPDRS